MFGVAFYNENGEIFSTAITAQKVFEHGQIVNGGTCFELDQATVMQDDLVGKSYVKGGVWKTRQLAPDGNHDWDNNTESWVVAIARLKTVKAKEIDLACKNAIVSGFTSAALGTTYEYPYKIEDQSNLNAVLSLASMSNPTWSTELWCKSGGVDGVWDYRTHTAEQLKQVGFDARSHVVTQQSKKRGIQVDIDALTSATPNVASVASSIKW